MKLLDLVGWSSMAIIPKTRQTKPTGVIVNEHTLTASQTRLHVETLSRWFDFIHYDDLLDRLSRPRSRPFCLLTFDDGKGSNATITAPELERLGVPAVFYVPTRFLTDGFPLWFDRSDAIRRALGYAPPELDGETLKKLPAASCARAIWCCVPLVNSFHRMEKFWKEWLRLMSRLSQVNRRR